MPLVVFLSIVLMEIHGLPSVCDTNACLPIYFIEKLCKLSGELLRFLAEVKTRGKKVNLSVYYETLCPPCAQFIVQNLITIFNNGIIDIVNLKLIPWGNARLSGTTNNTFICQNGPDECELNTVQACAIDVLNNVDKSYGLISCMELFVLVGQHQDWHQCFSTLGLSDKDILSCSNSTNGTKLDILHSQETSRLIPPHTFVPWVVVNNQSIGKDYGNFTTYVCNEYKGQPIPDACNNRNQITITNSDLDSLDCEDESVLKP